MVRTQSTAETGVVTVADDAVVKTEDRGAAETGTVDVATKDFAKAMVATGASIPVDFVIVTVAIAVVGETMVWELFSDISLVCAEAVPEKQIASLYSEWLEVVTGADGTVIPVAAEVTALVLGDSGADIILNFSGPVRGWGVLTPGIFCCRAPTAFIINSEGKLSNDGRATENKNLMSKSKFPSLSLSQHKPRPHFRR